MTKLTKTVMPSSSAIEGVKSILIMVKNWWSYLQYKKRYLSINIVDMNFQ